MTMSATMSTIRTSSIRETVNSFLNIGAAAITRDIPKALGRTLDPTDGLRSARIWTIALAVAGALTAQLSGTLVAFLGIFGYGLFASTLVPALAIGLTWERGTKSAALASIITGLAMTLALESAAYAKLISLPTGVTVSGLSLVTSILVYGASALLAAS